MYEVPIVVGWSVSGGFAASFGANVAIRGLSRGSKRKERRQGKRGWEKELFGVCV